MSEEVVCRVLGSLRGRDYGICWYIIWEESENWLLGSCAQVESGAWKITKKKLVCIPGSEGSDNRHECGLGTWVCSECLCNCAMASKKADAPIDPKLGKHIRVDDMDLSHQRVLKKRKQKMENHTVL